MQIAAFAVATVIDRFPEGQSALERGVVDSVVPPGAC